MVNYSTEANTALISINRPEKRNALNPDVVNELLTSFTKAANDPEVRAVILTGEGKSFCAGADLNYLSSLRDHDLLQNEKDSQNLARLFLDLYYFEKPVIAAVNGAAIAGGCGLASVCDIVIASAESKFGYSEVKIGFIPAIVSVFLIRKIGEGNARSLLLTGDIISGARAYELGFVNYLKDDVKGFAKELASRLDANSVSSMRMTKSMLNTISNLDIRSAVEYCVRLNALSRTTEDFIKGVSSFLSESK